MRREQPKKIFADQKDALFYVINESDRGPSKINPSERVSGIFQGISLGLIPKEKYDDTYAMIIELDNRDVGPMSVVINHSQASCKLLASLDRMNLVGGYMELLIQKGEPFTPRGTNKTVYPTEIACFFDKDFQKWKMEWPDIADMKDDVGFFKEVLRDQDGYMGEVTIERRNRRNSDNGGGRSRGRGRDDRHDDHRGDDRGRGRRSSSRRDDYDSPPPRRPRRDEEPPPRSRRRTEQPERYEDDRGRYEDRGDSRSRSRRGPSRRDDQYDDPRDDRRSSKPRERDSAFSTQDDEKPWRINEEDYPEQEERRAEVGREDKPLYSDPGDRAEVGPPPPPENDGEDYEDDDLPF